MKKISYLIIFLSSVLLFSCTPQEDNLFDDSTSNRVDAALKSHQKVLVGAENGWLMEYFPARNQIYGGFNLLAKFSNEEATFAGENALSLYTSKGFYSLKFSAGPVLTFDTYNEILHYFSDPNSRVSGVGTDGKGMEGDFEFLVMKATPDSIILKGKKTENKIVMTPLPKDKSWSEFLDEMEDASIKMQNKHFIYEVKGQSIPVSVVYRTLVFTYTNEDGLEVTERASYIQTKTGYKLYKPMNVGGVEVDEFVYDEATDTFSPKGGGDAKLVPFYPPLNAQFIGGNWYFKWSGFGSFGKTYWNHVKVNFMDPMGEEIYYAFMGLDASGKWGFNFTSYFGSGLYGGALHMNKTLIGDNKISMQFAMAGSGDGVWYHNNAGFNFILNTLGYSAPRTFTLTSDNDKDPKWIKLTDDSNPNNTYVLDSKRINFVYRN